MLLLELFLVFFLSSFLTKGYSCYDDRYSRCASSPYLLLFHATQSLYLTPVPPKMSSALPKVRSTRPLLRASTWRRMRGAKK